MAKIHRPILVLATAGLMVLCSTFAVAQTAANAMAAGIAKIVTGNVRVVDTQGERGTEKRRRRF